MKKPIALFLALLLAFSVTACGNDDLGSAGPALGASSLSPASLPASSPAGAEGTTVTAMFVLLGREEDTAIPWGDIEKIGTDVLLVRTAVSAPPRSRKKLFGVK